MATRLLAKPRPILHLFGTNPCFGVALIARAEAESRWEPVLASSFVHVDGAVVHPNEHLVCDNCGRPLSTHNLLQAVADYRVPGIDPFRVAMQLAVQRARGRAPVRPA